MNEKHIRGRFGEDYTADYLINKGLEIIARNFRRKGGELDIVALDGRMLVVVEVKARKFGSITDGLDAMTVTKRRNIIRTAQRFIDETAVDFDEMRFDVAELTLTTEKVPQVLDFSYYEDAFSADF
ncbi:MAG: YraN family protein [Oscillospiraceae bacterium]|nr:YraN family protein [Oscillospiraceae bacterium]